MRVFATLAFVAFVGPGCAGQSRPPVIDLSCDQYIDEPERDSIRVERSAGSARADSSSGRYGTLVVRPAAYRVDEPLIAPYRLRVYRANGTPVMDAVSGTGPFAVRDSAGPIQLELSCFACSRKRIAHELMAGSRDTVTIFLSRSRNTCEINAAKERAASRGVRPPHGWW